MSIVTEFAEVAQKYCEWAESAPESDDVLIVHRLLAQLQLKALNLPDLKSDNEYLVVEVRNNLEKIRDRLHTLPFEFYWNVFDVFTNGEEPVCGAMSDDLGDIYYDLKEGLYFFEKGNENEAAWRWRFSYFTHWGRHLTNAQTALHQYFADQGGPMQTFPGDLSS